MIIKFMEKLKQYKYIILILLVVLGLAFYWYEWRLMQIKKECADWAIKTINKNNAGRTYVPVAERADRNHKDFNDYYERCLMESGI